MPGLESRGPFLLLFAVGQQSRAVLTHTFRNAPLTPEEFAVYSVLRLTGPTTPSALADDLGMGRSAISNWLRRMESRGHVRRKPNPDDGRSALVSLTRPAVRLTEACFPAFTLAIETFRSHLGREEAALLASLERASVALAGALADLEGQDGVRAG